MRIPPFSLTADLNSGARRKTDIPKFYTIAQIAELPDFGMAAPANPHCSGRA